MTVRIGVSYISQPSGQHYLAALRDAGAEPVVLATPDTLPQWPTEEQVNTLLDPGNPAVAQLDGLDGFLLTGGGDIDPMLYREAIDGSEVPNWSRDHLEMAQFHRARSRNIPIFGICRGIQFLNVAMGGSLVQDLPSADEHRDSKWKKSHSHLVRVASESLLAQIISVSLPNDDQVVGVNSYHHQGISSNRLAPGLLVTAFSTVPDDGVDQIVEAVETPGTRSGSEFVLGVQWHPERVGDSAPVGERQMVTFADFSRSLFRAFVIAAEGSRSGDQGSQRVFLQV
jgi:putative glutamine amidotransferase